MGRMRKELEARQRRRNREGVKIRWRFSTVKARCKLGRHYDAVRNQVDGGLAPLHDHPSLAEGMRHIKELWEATVIESEYFLNDYAMLEQKFAQGKAGCITAALFRNLNRVETMVKNVTPTAGPTYADPPAGPTGKRGNGGVPKSGIATAISK